MEDDRAIRQFVDDLVEEIGRARIKFPTNEDRQTAFAEEAGEVAGALLEHKYGNATNVDVYRECLQAAATAARLAIEGDEVYPYRPPFHNGAPCSPPGGPVEFPILGGGGLETNGLVAIPWRLAEEAYRVYCALPGCGGQTLERLAERGGFHREELDRLVPDWWHAAINAGDLLDDVIELNKSGKRLRD